MKIPAEAVNSFLESRRSRSAGTEADIKQVPSTQYRFLLAVQLARAGHYNEAERTLLEVVGREPSFRPAALDLQAKMYAQQGRYVEAEQCWLEATRLAPGEPSYSKGLKALRKKHSRWHFGRSLLLVVLVVLAVWVGYWLTAERYQSRRQARNDSISRTNTTNQNIQNNYHEQMAVSTDLGRRFIEANQQLDRTLAELLQQFDGITSQLSRDMQAKGNKHRKMVEEILEQTKGLETDLEEREQRFSKSLAKTSQQLAKFDKALSKRLAKLEEKLSELQVSGEED